MSQELKLSTSLTFFWKYIFTGIWFVIFGKATIAAFLYSRPEAFIMLIAFIFGSGLLYYAFMRAKFVSIDRTYLHVSDFRQTIKIPIKNIKHVSENIMFSPRPIFIDFHKETEFGYQIMFIGYNRFFLFLASHPALIELKQRMKNK